MAKSRTSGQGRPRGIPNKVGRDVRALAGEHSEACIRTLAEIAGDAQQPPQARVAAIKELLLRAHGQPSARIETQLPAGTLAEQGQAAIAAALAGSLPVEQLNGIMSALAAQSRIIEQDELNARLEAIEKWLLTHNAKP